MTLSAHSASPISGDMLRKLSGAENQDASTFATENDGTAFRRVLEKFTQLTVVFPVVRNTPNMATWMFLDYAKQIDRYGVI